MRGNLGHKIEDAVEKHVESWSAGDDKRSPPPVIVLTDTHTHRRMDNCLMWPSSMQTSVLRCPHM